MTQRRALVMVVAVVILVVDGLAVARGPGPQSDWSRLLCGPVVFSQLGLLGVWVGVGRTAWWLRACALVVGMLLWLALMWGVNRTSPDSEAAWGFAAVACGTAGILAQLRRCGLRLHFDANGPVVDRGGASRQFTLGQLFLWVTLAAVILATNRFFLRREPWPSPVDAVWTGSSLTAITLIAVWATLGGAVLSIRLVVLAAACVLLGVQMGPWTWLYWLLIGLWTATVLLAFRRLGYRLCWSRGEAVAG